MKALSIILASVVLSSASTLWAADCRPGMTPGEECTISLDRLHPTQFTVAFEEAAEKAAKFRKMPPQKQEAYVDDHAAPIVFGPRGLIYIVDHHTTVKVLLIAGRTSMTAKVLADFSDLSDDAFWARMKSNEWVWLYRDACASGPSSPLNLPGSVASMKDDPYRFLAKEVRNAGGYKDTEEVFFVGDRWARFFCQQGVSLGTSTEDFQKAVKIAADVAHGPAAAQLPGYLPR